MKSIITVFAAFLFCVFCEGFSRLIIIFYHKSEFSLFGAGALPSFKWIYLIFGALILIYWLAGMLTITVTNFAPKRHLLSLGLLLILWRVNEMIQTSFEEPLIYYLISFILIPLSLSLCYLTQQKLNANSDL
jgi:hypothetical protein